ncbi:hypothetical protein BAB79_04590 [Mycobacteroides abscessus]|nr:phage antirepressor KilAC domain-containing protein [Mycobacteroides abscessus]AMU74028.1 hypothetical protein A3O06_04590 [Mycobacteroides abscessus]ANO22963.1 hypothetical protein BAB79_04590 [Mycobacteroides abscessus]
MSELSIAGDAAPFDLIKMVDEAGREYWSARDLMPYLGYGRWERFSEAIERAKVAARNSGAVSTSHFRGAAKVVPRPQGGGINREDVHLTRYAAYLVAMNGDPRKPEIAAAQTYFAAKTREAELVQAQIPQSYAEALRLAAEQVDRAEVAEAKALELEAKAVIDAPKVAAWDQFANADGAYSIGTVAKILGNIGQNTLFKLLRQNDVLIEGGDRHNTPYQRYAHHFKVRTRTRNIGGKNRSSYKTLVLPSGLPFVARKAAIPLPDASTINEILATEREVIHA